MKVMGGHILRQAMSLIGYDTIPYLKFVSRSLQANGVWQSTYGLAVNIKAQVQAISRSQIQYNGLDLNRNYIMIYTETPVNDLARDGEADRVIYGGRTYELLNATAWQKPQGFTGCMAVQVE